MKFEDVRDLSEIELKKRINQRKNDFFQMKMKNHMGELANPTELKTVRRDIAKMFTALQQSQSVADAIDADAIDADAIDAKRSFNNE